MTKREPVPASYFYTIADQTYSTADELHRIAVRKETEELGHECGHQFTISFSSVGHFGILGEREHRDAGPGSADKACSVIVRAHDLSDALRRAAALPLATWFPEEDEEDQL